MFYISQLFSTQDILEITREYPVGLEVISFSIGSVLDTLEESISHYKMEFKDLKVPMVFHGPFLDLNPGSCDSRIIELVKERFDNCRVAAEVFNVKPLVFHTGFVPRTYPEKYWLENTINFWQTFLTHSQFKGEIYIENVLEQDPYLLKELIDTMDDPRVKICLDIGHVNAHATTSIEEWIHVLGERIGHVHLHNNDGTRDAHRGLLHGNMNILTVMDNLMSLSKPNHFTLEMSNNEELRESIKWLQTNKYMLIDKV